VPYSIAEHKHRYAAWAASRAASTQKCRFKVQQGKGILEEIGLFSLKGDPNSLPFPTEVDGKHREWRNAAISAAEALRLDGFSHGVAAKLINVYLKSVFVCAGHEEHLRVAALHPPIDRLLLDSLQMTASNQSAEWAAARRIGWTQLSSDQYESLVKTIRLVCADNPLWQIESHWRGYQ